ncbi:MAG: sensor protein [Gemmatimonadetes bacterium]|nr:sensor protein [Gemmatimonadota bacterium]
MKRWRSSRTTSLPIDARGTVDELLNTLPCGVLSFADDGMVVTVNATLCQMLGYDAGEMEGRHVEQLLTVAGRIFYQTHVFPMVRLHGKAEELFLLFRKKDGTDLGALANVARHERAGVAVNDCAVIEVRERRKYEDQLLRARRDADQANALLKTQAAELETQHRLLQDQAAELEAQSDELRMLNDELQVHSDELVQARQVAEEANRAKSQFLATMSHELRTPLNAIGGYVQLIELGIYGVVTDTQREALDRISRSQRHLLRLINDILNLARIEAGRVEYAVEDMLIANVLANVIPMIEPQMAAAGLTFESTVQPDCVARADQEKVQQVLINLLTNAVKFTTHGGTVSLSATRDEQTGRVMVAVRDTGVGVPADKLAAIFEPFVQVETTHSRRAEGSGLGLAISHDLARGMGGDLTVESEIGAGSTFTLILPLA